METSKSRACVFVRQTRIVTCQWLNLASSGTMDIRYSSNISVPLNVLWFELSYIGRTSYSAIRCHLRKEGRKGGRNMDATFCSG